MKDIPKKRGAHPSPSAFSFSKQNLPQLSRNSVDPNSHRREVKKLLTPCSRGLSAKKLGGSVFERLERLSSSKESRTNFSGLEKPRERRVHPVVFGEEKAGEELSWKFLGLLEKKLSGPRTGPL